MVLILKKLNLLNNKRQIITFIRGIIRNSSLGSCENDIFAKSSITDPIPYCKDEVKIDPLSSKVPNVLEECLEDVSDFAPYHTPSFNLAAYVNKSYSLQELVKLRVNLSKIERNSDICKAILKLNFEQDIKKHITFLVDTGINPEDLGGIITKAPHILLQDLDDLQVRINYLKSKKFSQDGILRIITSNPMWLIFQTQNVDYRLGFFQLNFKLTGDEVRFVAVRKPNLITGNLSQVKKNIFSVKEEMGFSLKESKQLLLNRPKIFLLNSKLLVSRFDYMHNVMNIPHKLIASQPDGLINRKHRIQERHEFLTLLKKNQYDPLLPGFVSFQALLSGNDVQFCQIVAQTSIDTYNKFLKTR